MISNFMIKFKKQKQNKTSKKKTHSSTHTAMCGITSLKQMELDELITPLYGKTKLG